ncbi:MAG TPA: methionyl-tRNA formyltransferase, partial [Candidatus Brocadiia bacterium]|nr:methionyl-tRNA formyltransferase [Candidatus Brocadiia bacterium]
DEGDILLQRETDIGADETAGELHDRLSVMAAELWLPTLDGVESGSITPKPQDHSLATFAPTLAKGQGQVNWSQPAAAIHNFVRAMTPWPSAQTLATLASGQTLRLTILAVRPMEGAPAGEPGRVLAASAAGLVVAAGAGAVSVLRLQRAGKRPLDAAEFLRGCPIAAGDLFHAPA